MSTARPWYQRFREVAAALLWSASVGGGWGCSREPDLDEVFLPPRPINQVGARVARPVAYALSPDSEVTFTLGTRKRRVRGRVGVVHSEVSLDPDDLTSARGRITVDLSTIQIEQPESTGADEPVLATLTEQSLRWLELSPAPARDDAWRFARFSILSLGGASANAVVEGRPMRRQQPGSALRRVDFLVTGDLELHRYRIAYTVPVSATFELPEPPRAGQAPTRIELTTREPLRLDLIEHEVLPRDARGGVESGSVEELRKGYGQVARVSARWTLAPRLLPPEP